MTVRHLKIPDIILILFSFCCLLLLFGYPRIGQEPSYHSFADQREILDVPNFLNVATNLPFVIIGFAALFLFFKTKEHSANSLAYLTLFIGVIGIGLGSAWYHYNPANDTLVWDRIPMTITFMSYFSIIVSRYINQKFGRIILVPLLMIGIFSVCYWYITEQNGNGDLRLYALVQFYPMLCIPLILFLYPASKTVRLKIVSVIVVYAIAKVAENQDETIFNIGHVMSGHSLKHLFASISVLLILLTLKDETDQPHIQPNIE
jgi:hypothetical protein